MRKLTDLTLATLILGLIIGCAATYKQPTAITQDVVVTLKGSDEDIFNAAKQTLIMEGYQIMNADQLSGTISTALKRMKLNETQADCGTTMGLPYIKDNRTFTSVSIGLIINKGTLNMKSTIEGEYLKGNASQGVNLVCNSTGEIEKALVDKIKAKL